MYSSSAPHVAKKAGEGTAFIVCGQILQGLNSNQEQFAEKIMLEAHDMIPQLVNLHVRELIYRGVAKHNVTEIRDDDHWKAKGHCKRATRRGCRLEDGAKVKCASFEISGTGIQHI